jgi:hypothetical protein
MAAIRKTTSGHHLVMVYEAVNEDLHEIFVDSSSLLMESLVREHAKKPPKVIAHWSKDQRVSYRAVAYSVPVKDVRAFVENYAKSGAMEGWKVFL